MKTEKQIPEARVSAEFGGRKLEFYASNMSLVRYKRAGGSMERLRLLDNLAAGPEVDPEAAEAESAEHEAAAAKAGKPIDLDEVMEVALLAVDFLHANLAPTGTLTKEAFTNLLPDVAAAVPVYLEIANRVPWMGGTVEESAGEGTTDSSETGPTPSST